MNLKIAVLAIAVFFVALIWWVSSAPPTNELGEEYFIDPVTGDEYNPQEYTDPETLGVENIELEPAGFEKATTPGDCEKSTGFFRDTCYSNLALIKNDFSYCNTISQENFELIDICFYQVALKQKNTELCMKMSFGVTDCLTDIALENMDPAACEKAGFEKNNCLKAVRENSFEHCEKLGLDRRHCNDAVSNKDTSFCDLITNAGDSCFEQLALKTNNAEYCKKIDSNKDFCYYQIAVATNNHNLCELIQKRSDSCIAMVAFNTNNASLCDLAGEERQACLNDLQ